jgi:Fe-S-cluster containining protein
MINNFKCKKNCGECCGPIPISKELFEKHKDKIQREIKQIVGDFYLTEDLKCIFLNKETKKCEVYEDRPQICRNYGIGKNDALSCPYIKPNGNLRSSAMQRRIQRQIIHDIDVKMKRILKQKDI